MKVKPEKQSNEEFQKVCIQLKIKFIDRIFHNELCINEDYFLGKSCLFKDVFLALEQFLKY